VIVPGTPTTALQPAEATARSAMTELSLVSCNATTAVADRLHGDPHRRLASPPWKRWRLAGRVAALVPVQRINEIVRGKRGVTPETAWLLSQAFDTTPEFWIGLQTNHDLVLSRPSKVIPSLR